MIDTHAHIDTEKFDDDRAACIDRAFSAGVEKVIIPAIEPRNFNRLVALCESDSRLACGIGIHPHHVGEATEEDLELVKELVRKPSVAAVGEIGLEYFYDFVPKNVQREWFRKQLRIALDVDKPIIVHTRESIDDTLDDIESEGKGNLRGVLHCFSGTPEQAQRTLDLGLHVSFTGNITFKKSTLAETVAAVPLDNIMIETDSPYMAPVPHRGKRNEPMFVKHVAEKIAEIHNTTFEKVCEMTTSTAKQLFALTMLLLFIAMPGQLVAQDDKEDDYYYYEDEYEEETVANPFAKSLGFGFAVGGNTIVETETREDGSQVDRSSDGLLAYGGVITYSFTDRWSVQASALFSVNDKIKETSDQVGGNTHSLYDFGVMYTANPYNRLSFYGIFGGSLLNNSYDDSRHTESHFGLNGGIGLFGNIVIDGVGIIAPTMEWRVTGILGERFFPNLQNPNEPDDDVSFLSSIVKFQLQWYPNL